MNEIRSNEMLLFMNFISIFLIELFKNTEKELIILEDNFNNYNNEYFEAFKILLQKKPTIKITIIHFSEINNEMKSIIDTNNINCILLFFLIYLYYGSRVKNAYS